MATAIESANLSTVKAFKPTGFDHSISVFGNLKGRADWLVSPIGVNRDSGLLATCNWQAQCAALEALGDDEIENWEGHDFGHWACGWYRVIIVRPGSKAHKAVAEMACALESYPILSESAYSEAQATAREETWAGLSVRDRVELIKRVDNVSILAARRNTVPDDDRICEILDGWSES